MLGLPASLLSQVGALHQQQMFMNGRLLLPRQNRGPKLGTHWPAPLDIPFDIDDVRDELGVEVRTHSWGQGVPDELHCSPLLMHCIDHARPNKQD